MMIYQFYAVYLTIDILLGQFLTDAGTISCIRFICKGIEITTDRIAQLHSFLIHLPADRINLNANTFSLILFHEVCHAFDDIRVEASAHTGV